MNDALEAFGLYAVEEDVGLYDEQSDLEETFEGEAGLFQDEQDDFLFDDDDDDDLLEALDSALDEIEAEERRDAIREVAAPAFDISEIEAPSPEVVYRTSLESFLGRKRDLPRPAHTKRRRQPVMDGRLQQLLNQSMEQARASLDRRRAKVWVSSVGSSAER